MVPICKDDSLAAVRNGSTNGGDINDDGDDGGDGDEGDKGDDGVPNGDGDDAVSNGCGAEDEVRNNSMHVGCAICIPCCQG